MFEIERKTLSINLKADGEEGEFIARFATLNVKDKDGDVTLSGAIPAGRVVPISSFSHGSWGGALTVGGAKLLETDNQAIAMGRFNLKTQAGREHYETLKFNQEQGILTEWSYGFKPLEFNFGEWEGQQVRFLKKVDVFEVSPVLKGAGIDTSLLALKSNRPLEEHAETALAVVSEFLARCKSLADLRAKDGRVLNGVNVERLTRVGMQLQALQKEVGDLREAAEPEKGKALMPLWMEYQKIQASLVGATKE